MDLPPSRKKKEVSVENTLVIVFDDEAKAYGASHALQGLEEHGDLTLDELAIIVKRPNGSACTTKSCRDRRGVGRIRTIGRESYGRTWRRLVPMDHRSNQH